LPGAAKVHKIVVETSQSAEFGTNPAALPSAAGAILAPLLLILSQWPMISNITRWGHASGLPLQCSMDREMLTSWPSASIQNIVSFEVQRAGKTGVGPNLHAEYRPHYTQRQMLDAHV
jgi:hypothetical protein